MDRDNCGDGYLAGVFDGEGSVSVKMKNTDTDNRWYSLRARISMVNKNVLSSFKKRFGGSLTLEPGQKSKSKPQWTWLITMPKEPFLRVIQPYLIEKRAQVDLALQYIEEFGEGRNTKKKTPEQKVRQQWYCEEFKRLKQVCEGCQDAS